MSRRLNQQFNCRPLADLTRQLLVAPPRKRIEQVRRAEKLHDEIDPQRNYPFDFVNYRITGFHTESEDLVLVGEALGPDLRLLIDSLSRSVDMPTAQKQLLLSPRQLAAQLNVSTKTIERWRKLGLRWRWVQPAGSPNRHKQVVFTQRAVDVFLARYGDRVERAGRFTQMDEPTRRRLIDQARQLASEPGMSIYRVARRLGRQSGRAVETVRLLLEHHERHGDDDKIFVHHTGPLTPRQKRLIARARRRGVPVTMIADHFRRSPPTIRRVVQQQRAEALRNLHIDYVANPIFRRQDADKVLLGPLPGDDAGVSPPPRLQTALTQLPELVRPIYDQTVLAGGDQKTRIVRLNYLKFKAATLRDTLDDRLPKKATMDQIDAHLQQAAAERNYLAAACLPHVLLVARQHLGLHGDDMLTYLIDLLEMGNDQMIIAIDTYDATQAQAFEPFLIWSLKRRYAKYATDPGRARKRLTDEQIVDRLRKAAAARNIQLLG